MRQFGAGNTEQYQYNQKPDPQKAIQQIGLAGLFMAN